jgi:transposase
LNRGGKHHRGAQDPECLTAIFRPWIKSKFGCPRRLPFTLNPSWRRTIKKQTRSSKKLIPREEAGRKAAEIYAAPKPPVDGRIIGLDCHPDTYTAAVFRGSTPHDAQKLCERDKLSLESLLAWVAKEFTSADLFLLEAGSNSFEIHRRLLALGVRAVVLESCHVGQRAKSYADNDKMAAARLVRVYLAGDAPCVWVPDPKSCERRELLHAQQSAVAAHTAAVNTLKSYLSMFAIRPGSRSLQLERTRAWVLKQRDWLPMQRELLTIYFAELDAQAQRRKQLTRLIAQEVSAEPLMLRCMKLLGIGMINAFALLAIIGDVRRFERPEKLVAYIGLNPGQRQSGAGKNIKIGVGKRGRGDLRHLLIQGSQAVLKMGRNTPLGKWGWKLFARKGHRNIAVAAIARKLAVQVWHLLAGNPPVIVEPNKSLALKLQKLAVLLGKSLRVQMGLPSNLKECIQQLQERILCPSST